MDYQEIRPDERETTYQDRIHSRFGEYPDTVVRTNPRTTVPSITAKQPLNKINLRLLDNCLHWFVSCGFISW